MSPKRILLTGSNGFLGTHILRQLLSQPEVKVRAVVRSSSKVDAVKHDFPNASNLDFAIVPDITAEGAFDDALSESEVPFDAVIHSASPFLYRAVSDNREFLDPALRGTVEILKAVKAVALKVKRVVITSSFAAVGDLANPENMKGRQYSDDDWNPITWEEALTSSKGAAYQGSKKFAEEAAWTFLRDEEPTFDIVTICPPMIYGPIEHTVQSMADLNESTGRIYNLFINSTKSEPLPPNALYLYSDPRDVAAAHIAALLTPAAGNNRFIICAGQVTSQQIADILRADFPELEERTPIGHPHENGLPEEPFSASSKKAEKVLGVTFRPLEKTFHDLGAQLLELEKMKL